MAHFVSFPTSESTPAVPQPVPHLPFRRISLPTAPNLAAIAYRHSVVSVSADAEEALVLAHQHRRSKRRSLNPGARSRRRTPENDARDAKRGKIVSEFFDTERSYLDGLDLVYNHFLTPILASLDTDAPLLTRKEITALFSNFIDIWNFHHTFFSALTVHLRPQTESPSGLASQFTSLSSVLLAHFPYLSLYTPFIRAFPESIQLLSSLSQKDSSNPSFKAFLRTQESHPSCVCLRLSDYLLTPVQRCPRYLLLLKDILAVTDPTDPEWDKLQEVHCLVEKSTVQFMHSSSSIDRFAHSIVTSSLNTSLAVHAQTMELISLQRLTRDLPACVSPLVAPGRQLIKRGPLIREGAMGEGWGRKRFEFVLLSDYFLWLEREESVILFSYSHDAKPRPRQSKLPDGGEDEKLICRGFVSLLDMEVVMAVGRSANGGAPEERLEILSPEGSFALYAQPDTITSWVTALRLARAARLAAVALSHPDSTLSASSSNIHIRRALKAFISESDHNPRHLEVVEVKDSTPSAESQDIVKVSRRRRAQLDNFLPPVWVSDAKTDACMRCGRPFGFVLDLGLADVFSGKTGAGGNVRHRVQKNKGAWRRKHHCRLCGHVVCAACSDRTFYIMDAHDSTPHKKSKSKAARACDECYEAAFPIIIDNSCSSMQPLQPGYPTPRCGSSEEVLAQTPTTPTSILLTPDADPDTVRGIQPWLSIPNRQRQPTVVSEALMTMDAPSALSRNVANTGVTSAPSSNADSPRKRRFSSSPNGPSGLPRNIRTQGLRPSPGSSPSPSPSKRIAPLPRITSVGDVLVSLDSADEELVVHMRNMDLQDDPSVSALMHVGPIRIRPPTARPRSYHDILEDFNLHERGLSVPSSVSSGGALGAVNEREGSDDVDVDEDLESADKGECRSTQLEKDESEDESNKAMDHRLREDTARRQKRFSLPAVALQTAPVFARPRSTEAHRRRSHTGEEGSGLGNRFSLMHGGGGGSGDGSAMGILIDILRGGPRAGT